MGSHSRDDRLAMAMKAAELYFVHGLDQSAVGQRLGCSPPTVSRLLKEARELGIVQVTVRNPKGRLEALEARLKERWSLLHAVVVAGRFGDDAAAKVVGHAASLALAEWIGARSTGGVALGKTIFEVVESLRASPAGLGVHVVPLVGGLTSAGVEYQANELTRRLADSLGGTWRPFNVPALASTPEVCEVLLREPAAQEVAARWKSLDWVLVGIGPEIRVSHLISAHEFSAEERHALVEFGAVGDICGRFFDEAGRECPAFSGRLLTIDSETLRRVPLRIGVAAGPHKRRSVRGALAGRWINALVTDEATAAALLDVPSNTRQTRSDAG